MEAVIPVNCIALFFGLYSSDQHNFTWWEVKLCASNWSCWASRKDGSGHITCVQCARKGLVPWRMVFF